MDPQVNQNEQSMWNKPYIYKVYGIFTVKNTVNILYTS